MKVPDKKADPPVVRALPRAGQETISRDGLERASGSIQKKRARRRSTF